LFEDAGDDDYNGLYERDGDYNGAPFYQNENDLSYAQLWWSGSKWVNANAGSPSFTWAYYSDDGDSSEPPTTGWTVQNGSPPAPTVTKV
jgi:hypothetical protein